MRPQSANGDVRLKARGPQKAERNRGQGAPLRHGVRGGDQGPAIDRIRRRLAIVRSRAERGAA